MPFTKIILMSKQCLDYFQELCIIHNCTLTVCILKLFIEEGTWCLYANVRDKVIDGGQILLYVAMNKWMVYLYAYKR